MDQTLIKKLKLKPLSEILARLNEIIHKHRRRYVTRFSKACPRNCTKAHDFAVPVTFAVFNSEFSGKHRGMMCEGCGSNNLDVCKKESEFECKATKEQLVEQFKKDLRNPAVLLRDYRDIAFFLWVVGAFDEEVDEAVIGKVETHVEKPIKAAVATTGPSVALPAAVFGGSRRPAPVSGNKAGGTAKAIGAPANRAKPVPKTGAANSGTK